MSWRHEMARIRGLAPPQRRLAIEAGLWLGVIRLAVLALPFRWVASALRLEPLAATNETRVPEAIGGESPSQDVDAARAVGRVVRAVAAHTPWSSTCLVQSLTGHMLLRRRHVTSTVILGVATDSDGGLIAHSWLICGDLVVTGGAGREHFRPIAAYRPTAHVSR